MEEKRKVGRPKLADTKLKKSAIITIIICFILVVTLIFGGILTFTNNKLSKLNGKMPAPGDYTPPTTRRTTKKTTTTKRTTTALKYTIKCDKTKQITGKSVTCRLYKNGKLIKHNSMFSTKDAKKHKCTASSNHTEMVVKCKNDGSIRIQLIDAIDYARYAQRKIKFVIPIKSLNPKNDKEVPKGDSYNGYWGTTNKKVYKKLKNKKVLMFGTSIGMGRCTYIKKKDKKEKCNRNNSRPFIKLISDLNDMKLTNYAYDGCGGVYSRSINYTNGYFMGSSDSRCHGVLGLSTNKVKKYDFIIIEGFANDVEHPKKVSQEDFSKELNAALSYLRRNKKNGAIIMVVQTPQLPNSYNGDVKMREYWTKNEAKDITQSNNAFFCSTYSVDAHYTSYSKDHPTYYGHIEMAEIVEQCMVDALDGKLQQTKSTIKK